MTNSPYPSLEELRNAIVIELTNHYYETYRYERPNDSTEQLSAFCRDIAANEIDELIAEHHNRLLTEIADATYLHHDRSLVNDTVTVNRLISFVESNRLKP